MIFIAGSREISQKRFLSLLKHYLKKDDVTFGFYKEEFIEGLDGQPQFKTSQFEDFKNLVLKIKKKLETGNWKLEIMEYSQREEVEVIRKLKPRKCVFINGSWKIVFHRRAVYEFLEKENIGYSLKSPFDSDQEAREYSEGIQMEIEKCISLLVQQCNSVKIANYELRITNSKNETSFVIPDAALAEIRNLPHYKSAGLRSDLQSPVPDRGTGDSRFHGNDKEDDRYFLELAKIASYRSFDYTWQTGAVLVKDGEVIAWGHNAILPYETYAMHYGSEREKHKSDLNSASNYDTIHAEMHILSQVIQKKLNIENCSLYINLMPCPACARMLAASGIKRVVCAEKHFGGYAEGLFRESGVELIVKSNFL